MPSHVVSEPKFVPALPLPRWQVVGWVALVVVACTHVWRFAADAVAPTALPGSERCVIVVAGVVLLLAAFHAHRRPAGWHAHAAAGLACGALWFVKQLGLAVLDPGNLGWLLAGGDWQQHYFGWAFYRQDGWHWPPGVNTHLLHPVGTSVVFTDSVPWLAMSLKPFDRFLPADFQYIGIVLACNALLQGAFAALLARAAGLRLLPSVLFALLLLSWPVFFQRIHQEALNAQWMLLAALMLYVAEMRRAARQGDEDARQDRRETLAWASLLAIAALTHPYLCVMLFGLFLASEMQRVATAGRIHLVAAIARVCGGLFLVAMLWYLAGGFTIAPTHGLGTVPLGHFSANLLTFIDPGRFSDWRAGLPRATGGQHSGFAYFGIGLGFVVLVACAHAAWRRKPRTGHAWWPLALVAIAAAAFAVSPKATFGSRVLFDASAYVPDVLGTFRASGRFIWVTAYALLAFACVRLARMPQGTVCALLALALCLEVAEFDGVLRQHAALRTLRAADSPAMSLRDPRWDLLARGRRHLVLLPPPMCGGPAQSYVPYAVLATRHGMTLNAAYLARTDANGVRRYCRALRVLLRDGPLPVDTLFVVDMRQAGFAKRHALACQQLDGRLACVRR